MSKLTRLDALLAEVRACTLCAEHLPLGPRPTLRLSRTARLLIVGQAPGTKVHATGIPWNDPSGNRLHRIEGQQKAPPGKGEGFAAVTEGTMKTIADQTIDQLATWLSAGKT